MRLSKLELSFWRVSFFFSAPSIQEQLLTTVPSTRCGGTRFTNSQNSVKQVDNDVVLPIKSGEVCQKCLICSNVQLNHFIEGNYPDAQYVQQGTG